MPGPPGRDPRSARSNERQSFAGHGTRTTVEKDGIGLFIDDTVYAFADVSVPSLPVLWTVMVTSPVEYGGVNGAAFVGWMTMVLGAALIRGGWIGPLFTEIPGWVSLTPTLVALRVLYFNLALAVAAYGGGLFDAALRLPLAFVGWSLLVSAVAVWLFPSLAGAVARRRAA
ncbi:hypothetical protein DMJ13_05755 [halophilic archaeon]|nr:hypothetical protein DMJ13_05755 [halophilic archaeon]